MQQAVADLNRRTGSNVDPTADPNELMQSNTRNLMSAISSLPQLTERKKTIDKHTNMATALLRQIQARALKQYWDREEDCLHGKPDLAAIETLLQVSSFDGRHQPSHQPNEACLADLLCHLYLYTQSAKVAIKPVLLL